MAEGIIGKWFIKLLGTSWKSSLFGVVSGTLMLIAIYRPDLFPKGIGEIINAIALIVFGRTMRENNVNDKEAGVNHD